MKEVGIEISVVLAVYNGALYLKDAIESILIQTFKDFEFVIVNDGSTDSTAEIILSYHDSRIVYLENEENKGLIYSLNRGLSASRGKYIARMDADDIALAKRLQVQYDFMETHPETGICGSIIEVFSDNGEKRKIIWFPEDDKAVRAYTYFQAAFCHPTVMMRKAVLEKNKIEYPGEFFRTEDYALWINLLQYTKAYNIQEVLLHYRKHEGSETWLSGKENNRVSNASLIQGIYMQQNGIEMDPEDLFLFSCFVNRSKGCSLNIENQQSIGRILDNFFYQLCEKQKDLAPIAMEYVSSACFYHFVKNRLFPRTAYLKKLYFRGLFTFVKRFPVYVRRRLLGQ